ncbi:MAG: hypothetical protein LBQ46_07770 [Treponema sp.]|jgi:hypothetical protein|nr:hypothetical protein [Treponema sp.]
MKKSLLFGSIAAAALFLLAACGSGGDASAPDDTPETVTGYLEVVQGATAFKVKADSGTLNPNLKVFIADNGSAILISTGDTPEDYTQRSRTLVGNTIVVKGLARADVNGGAGNLKPDPQIPVTLDAKAQASRVYSIKTLSKLPGAATLGNNTYTKKTALSADANEVWYTNGAVLEGNGTGQDDPVPLDPEIDAQLIAVFNALQLDDTFAITGDDVTAISLNNAPAGPGPAAFNAVLALGVQDVTLSSDFVVGANETLTITAGVNLTLDGSTKITLTRHASTPGKIVFAGSGATLVTSASGGSPIVGAGGLLVTSNNTAVDKIPVSSFSGLTITGGSGQLDSITYNEGTNPWISGPKNSGGGNVAISSSTSCS